MLVLSSRFLSWFVSSLFVEISNARVGILGCYHRTGVLCRGTWYYSLGVFLAIVDAFVSSEFEISSWRGARVDVRTYLLGGAINGSKANGIIRDPKLELESSRFTFDLVPLSTTGATPICEGSCRLTSLERQEVWNDCRNCKSHEVNKKNHVVEPIRDAYVKHSLLNANSKLICATYNKCMFDAINDKCLLDFVKIVNGRYKSAKKHKKQNIWKPTSHVFTEVGFKWKPTGRTFTLVGNSCPLTRITPTKVVPIKESTSSLVETSKPELKVYSRRPKHVKIVGSSKKDKIVESKNANNSKPNHTWGSNAINIPSCSSLVNDRLSRFFSVRFENDQIAKIMGYGDCQLENVIISRVYYMEGLRHNLFSVGQFCDANLEVVFWKNTCFIRNLEGFDLLSGSRDTNLYTISLDDMLKTSSICLLSKASKTKSWLWHRQLSHLNFDTLNKLAKDGLARGIPKLKFQIDHLCSAYALGKSKKSSHQPKAEDTNQEKLYLLHMDMTKDEAPEAIIKCIKNIKVRLNATVRNVQTDNGSKFFNQTLREFYENVGISHETFVARTPQQNDIVERRNRTLIEVVRTMLIFSKALLFLWAEAINTTCYTQNRSLIRLRYNKTPYELMQDKNLDLSFLHVFGSLCYPTNNSEDLGKLDAKSDIILVAAAPRVADLADSPVSTSIDHDAPSSSIPSTQEQEHSPIISLGLEESPKTPLFHDDPLHESLHEDSTSHGSSSNMRPTHTLLNTLVDGLGIIL
ncbi:retrovirus-related pol polyprotein from transposon TNT 1-94 [Tanacetum coccineum]